MLLNNGTRPIDAADASCVQPGCVCAEGNVTRTRVKHLYYSQQIIGFSLWQCYSLYSALHPPQPVRGLCRGPGSGGARRPPGLGCAAPKVVQRLSLSCIGRLWPFTEEHLRAVHLRSMFAAHYYSSTASPPPHTHYNTWQELDSLPNKSVCGGEYLHAVKIQDDKRTRVEILL